MNKELTKAELEIMKLLWEGERMFVNDILSQMPDPKPAYNTVSTIIRILEKKGVVAHESFGKTHRYYPLLSKDEYMNGYMNGVMKNFFNNSVTQLFSFFASKENLSVSEIEELMRIAEQAKQQKEQ